MLSFAWGKIEEIANVHSSHAVHLQSKARCRIQRRVHLCKLVNLVRIGHAGNLSQSHGRHRLSSKAACG